jgi:hypothetical protein
MELVQINIADIAELATPVAMHGAVGLGEMASDELFELLIGVVMLVIETMP